MVDFETQLRDLENYSTKKGSLNALLVQLNSFSISNRATSEQLKRAYTVLFPLFLKTQPDYYDKINNALYWKAQKLFFQSIYNKNLKHSCLMSSEEAYKALLPFFKYKTDFWKKNPSNTDFITILWRVFTSSALPIQEAFTRWLPVLVENKLIEPSFKSNITLAIEWETAFNTEGLTSVTKKDFDLWLAYLDHESQLLRSVAAKKIGNTYTDWQDDVDEFQGNKHLPITELLDLLYQKETEGKQVVGGFINGHNYEGLLALEKNTLLTNMAFDLKNWVIKTAIDSPENEYYTYNPAAQAFWFYIHEYLDRDPSSIEKLIDGKSYWLAMMCATESMDYTFSKMKRVFERLINEGPSTIAKETKRQMQIYLQKTKGTSKEIVN